MTSRDVGGVRPGEEWGEPARGPADVECSGDDAALAALVDRRGHVRVRLGPGTTADLARAIGLPVSTPGTPTLDLPVDVLRVHRIETSDTDASDAETSRVVVNAVVLGTAPARLRRWQRRAACEVEVDGRIRFAGRAGSVVVANGQYLEGLDLIPRGHPGDGRLEVQVYALAPGQRAELRRRVRTGTHLPHPEVTTATGRRARVRWSRPRPLELDGHRVAPAREVEIGLETGLLTIVI